MRLTTLFFAFVNYAFNDKGRRAGKATLFHSLRLTEEMALKQKYLTKSQKLMRSKNEIEIEWNSSLSHTNLIDTPEGIVPLANFSQEQREQMMFEILQPQTMKSADARKFGQDKARSKNKLKEWIKAGHFCKKGIELVDEIFSSDSLINVHHAAYRLNLLNMKRKAQRVEQLVNYIKAHNALLDKPNSLNSVNFEELLFKIPINNQIGTDIVSNEEMMHAMKSFLQRYYPDHPIKLMVLHHDERLPGEITGGHVHAFISGKNASTHQYDLRLAHIRNVNAFLFDRKGVDAELLSEKGRLNREQAGDVAKHMQEMFYEFVNEHLFHPKGINADFHPESVRKSEKRMQMRKEAKLAKRDRSFNYHTRLLEDVDSLENKAKKLGDKISQLEKTVDDLENKAAYLSENCETLIIKRDALKQQCIQQEAMAQTNQRRLSKKMRLEQEVDERLSAKVKEEKKLDASIWLKQQKHTELDSAIAEKQSILDRLSVMTTQALYPIHKMLEHMNNRLILKGRAGATEFMQHIIKAFSADLPAELRKTLIKITNNTGDTELENGLTRKDSQINDSLDM
ncbi:hypothetical protein [Shewanella sp. S1-49-MNA-CIBAN-0167]|uniref:coiled-coil domain-containing protein n=1 Tax=Shewanella sp. S1-49-MNA-CIBAN-0167 TaxID=3140468 RepID=UPI00331ECA52